MIDRTILADRLSASLTQDQRLVRQAAPDAVLARELARAGDVSYTDFLFFRGMPVGHPVALIHRERSWSYPELFAAVAATARALADEHRVAAGDPVVIRMENSAEYIILYLAVLRMGAIAVPINPRLTVHEAAYIVSDAAPALFVSDDDQHEHARAVIARSGKNTVSIVASRVCQLESSVPPAVAIGQCGPAAIFYTSGTTGKPKGVVHTHECLIAGALQSSRAWQYDRPGLVTLATTPLFHIAAHAWFLPVLAHGGTLVVDSYRTERAFQLIETHRVNGFGAVPSMLLMMTRFERRADYDLSSVLNVRFGASPMPPDKLADVQALFPNAELHHGMGQTESGGTISVLPGTQAFARNGSTGHPLPGCQVRIVDDNDNDLPIGEIGEVLARGPNIMQEYYNNPDATRTTLRGGWLHTGDLGYIDADGYIFLVDRKKDMIIRGGENIYSVEVENALLQHPDVLSAAVVAAPSDLLGEEVCAFVVLKDNASTVTPAVLQCFCRGHLADFKIPATIVFVPELQCTATGKIQKAELRSRIGQIR